MTTNISFEKTVSLEKNNSTKTKPYFSVSLLKWMQHKEWLKRNQHTVVEGVNHTTCTVPEITHWGFSSYLIIFPFLLERYRSIHICKPPILNTGWNIIDAVASLVAGLTQILDKSTHRPIMQRTKGCINVSSGIQLIVLTAMASPAAPIAFIVAAALDFLLSLEPFIHCYLRRASFRYWLKDSMEALSKLEQEVSSLAEEQKDFDTWCQEILAQPMHQHLRADLNWIAEKKQERMEYLISELNHLSKLILYRLAYRKDNLDQSILDEIEKNVAIDNAFAKINSTEQFDIDLNKMEESIHQQLRHELLATTQESIVFALALIGWTLFLIPGLQLHAIIFISLGTASYLLKNVYELWTFAQTKEDHNLSYTY